MAPHFDPSDGQPDRPFKFDDPGQRDRLDKLKADMTAAIRKMLSSVWSGSEEAVAVRGVSVEDVRQEALLRLSDSVGSFKGGSFTAFATTIARNAAADEMRQLLSKKRGQGRVLSTDALASGDRDATQAMPSDVDVEAQAMAVAILDALEILTKEVLTRNEGVVFWEYVYFKRPRNEIAKKLNVSPQYVSQLKMSALDKLKRDPRFPL